MTVFQNNILKGRFFSVYDETEDNSTFHVCRYLCSDSTTVLFQAITTRGYDDGFYLIPMDYIYRVDVDDEYTKRIEKLFHMHNQPLAQGICVSGENTLLVEFLCHAQKNKLITSLFLDNGDDVTGWILNVDTKGCGVRIEQLTENGERNGTVFLSIENVEKVICNSGVERCIEMLIAGAQTNY